MTSIPVYYPRLTPMYLEPDPKTVRAFWLYMQHAYGTVVVDKSTSRLMRLAANALGLMGVVDAVDFMSKYSTTIGKTIFVPFVIGEPDSEWSLWDEIVVCVHEHTHVDQYERLGAIPYTGRYLLDHASRAAFEAEAYRSNLELHHWRFDELIDPAELAENLWHYGCTMKDIAVTEKSLSLSAETIKRGGVINRSSQIAIPWLEQHAPELVRAA